MLRNDQAKLNCKIYFLDKFSNDQAVIHLLNYLDKFRNDQAAFKLLNSPLPPNKLRNDKADIKLLNFYKLCTGTITYNSRQVSSQSIIFCDHMFTQLKTQEFNPRFELSIRKKNLPGHN